MNIQSKIESFIIRELPGGGDRTAIGPDEPLISSGILDSLGLLRLITFLEEQMGLTIGDGEVGPENFQTLRKIADFAERKTTQSAKK